MSVTVSPMGHSYQLVDDFFSLDHWSEYGSTTREYGLRSDTSVEGGNALWIGGSGALRLIRETDIPPGVPVVFSLWVWADSQGRPPTEIRISDRESAGSIQTVMAAGEPGMVLGWNRVLSRLTPSESWAGVDIRLFITGSRDGGGIARLRAMPADTEGIDQ